jgi:WD40 repeat protein
MWDVESGQLLRTYSHDGGVHAGLFLPDARHVVTGSKDARSLKVWDAKTGELVAGASELDVGETGMVIVPDGRRLVTTLPQFQLPPQPAAPGVMQIWRLPESVWPQTEPLPESAEKVARALEQFVDDLEQPNWRSAAERSTDTLVVVESLPAQAVMRAARKLRASPTAAERLRTILLDFGVEPPDTSPEALLAAYVKLLHDLDSPAEPAASETDGPATAEQP